MRVTVPSPLFATHTEPAPTVTPAGARPTGIVVVTARVLGIDPNDRVVERVSHPDCARADRDPARAVTDCDRCQ